MGKDTNYKKCLVAQCCMVISIHNKDIPDICGKIKQPITDVDYCPNWLKTKSLENIKRRR